ncbi:hypothetical protein FQA39_LY03807 [Lamprigera yunnana]|nr:hypothetical protein FQA39_LY03807 [Lamprigera yunnana]
MQQFFFFGKQSLSNSLNVYIKTSGGSTLSVNLDPQWDIKNIKKIVGPKLGLKPEEVKIIFAGKELNDNVIIADCDLGQCSVLHAVKTKRRININSNAVLEEIEDVGSKPLCETLKDLSTDSENLIVDDETQPKAHFYVYCSTCKSLKKGKLRVRCHFCKSGAFTVHADPQNWTDVLECKQITGQCENDPNLCENVLNNAEPTFAEFYFKCSEHASLGEDDKAVPLFLIHSNVREVPCLACGDVCDPILVFPCSEAHVTCLECFNTYCSSRLQERQFYQHPVYGYTLPCPAGCEDSFITEVHHFRLLTETQYTQYQRFATEEFVLQNGGVLCPQPNCGMGIIPDGDCRKVACLGGCGYVFCRLCSQGYHIGACDAPDDSCDNDRKEFDYNVDPARASQARWDEASKTTIRVMTKPCPKCKTPTERDGGCMHMICMRSGCNFSWCWVCQTAWKMRQTLPVRIPRPANAFMIYANENRKQMAQRYPQESNKDISKRLGATWKALDLIVKKKYFDLARTVDAEHKKKYPVMDCCNYMHYKHSYYRPQFFDNGFYNRDYYGHPYQSYYTNAGYYPQQWPNSPPLPDYVYNPKEARIRKAMREASREQNVGAAPISSPRGGRRSQTWTNNLDEQLMMTPPPELGSQMCNNPIFSGHTSNIGEFMPSMDAYTKLVHVLPSSGWLPNSPTYIQSDVFQHNSMAELQHQAHMWHQYHEPLRPCGDSPYLLETPQNLYADGGCNDVLPHKKCKSQMNTMADNRESDEVTISLKSNSENSAKHEKIDDSQQNNAQILAGSADTRRNKSYLSSCENTIIVENPFDQDDDITLKKEVKSHETQKSNFKSENKANVTKKAPIQAGEMKNSECQHCKLKISESYQNKKNPYYVTFPFSKSSHNGGSLEVFLDNCNSNLIYTDVGMIPMYDNSADVNELLNIRNLPTTKCIRKTNAN